MVWGIEIWMAICGIFSWTINYMLISRFAREHRRNLIFCLADIEVKIDFVLVGIE